MRLYGVDALDRMIKPHKVRSTHRVAAQYAACFIDQSGIACQIALCALLIVAGASLQHITEGIVEMTDPGHLVLVEYLCLQLIIHRCRHVPSLTVYKGVRFDLQCFLPDQVHCMDIDDAHQVKTESVDTIGLHQESDRMKEQVPRHRTQRVQVIAAE